jgi:hypothetical protein
LIGRNALPSTHRSLARRHRTTPGQGRGAREGGTSGGVRCGHAQHGQSRVQDCRASAARAPMFCDGSQKRRPGEGKCPMPVVSMRQSETSESESDDVPRKKRQTDQRQAAEGELERGQHHFSTFEGPGGRGSRMGRRVNKTQTPSFSAQRRSSPLIFLHHHSHHIIFEPNVPATLRPTSNHSSARIQHQTNNHQPHSPAPRRHPLLYHFSLTLALALLLLSCHSTED